LPKAALSYTLKEWHRGYRKEEIRKLLSFLDDKVQKLYVYLCCETGLRAQTVLDIRYKHIKEDLQRDPPVMAVAVRLGPEYYGKKKSAGYTFIGKRCINLIRELVKEKRIKEDDESPLVDRTYTV